MRKQRLIIGFLLLFITNAFVLAHVVYNRSDEVVTITLTERELRKSHYSARENSGQSLRLKWRTPGEGQIGYHRLRVSDEQLQELGFDDQVCHPGVYRKHRKEKEAWVLMELAGEAYHNDIIYLEEKLKEAKDNPDKTNDQISVERVKTELDNLKQSDSRLYVIAVSDNKESLEKRVAAKKNQFVTRGIIGKSNNCNNELVIGKLFIKQLHLPRRISAGLAALPEQYQVELAIGKLGEGWVKQLQKKKTD